MKLQKPPFGSCEISNRSGKYEINGFIGVTDNGWFSSLSQQLLLPKTVRQSATQPADKKDGGQAKVIRCFSCLF